MSLARCQAARRLRYAAGPAETGGQAATLG
jgi:hypothetical protein